MSFDNIFLLPQLFPDYPNLTFPLPQLFSDSPNLSIRLTLSSLSLSHPFQIKTNK